MRQLVFCYLMLFFTGAVLAQAEVTRDAPAPGGNRAAEIAAATDCAVGRIMEQADPARILPDLTVGDFLDRTGGREDFRAALARTDPVGGPRWLDDKTCQVRLEISGTEMIVALANVAVKHADRSPLAASELPRVAGGLSARWFAATGTSTAAGVAPAPPPDSAWAAVPVNQRRRAVAAADADAARTVLNSISTIQLTPGHSVGEATGDRSVRQSLLDWLTSQPVTAVDYRQNDQKQLEVQVTLAARASDFFDILRATVTARGDIPHPAGAAGWAAVRNQVLHQMAAPIGRAVPAAGPLAVVLPAHPPEWANTMLDVTGRGGPSATALRAARAAEADAMAHLKRQVLDLRLTDSQTIADAAAHDPRLSRSLDRAIARSARLYKSEYRADGTVVVRLSLDLRLLWAGIEDRP